MRLALFFALLLSGSSLLGSTSEFCDSVLVGRGESCQSVPLNVCGTAQSPGCTLYQHGNESGCVGNFEYSCTDFKNKNNCEYHYGCYWRVVDTTQPMAYVETQRRIMYFEEGATKGCYFHDQDHAENHMKKVHKGTLKIKKDSREKRPAPELCAHEIDYTLGLGVTWEPAENGFLGTSPVYSGNVLGFDLYVCAAFVRGFGLQAGHIAKGQSLCYVAYGAGHISSSKYLVIKNKPNYIWVSRNDPRANTRFVAVEPQSHKPTGICRRPGNSHAPYHNGKLLGSPANGTCHASWGNSSAAFSDFEVLIKN